MSQSRFKQSLVSAAVIAAIGMTGYASAEIEEIQVTARKRAESLQKVPMAVSASNSAELKAAMMTTMEDLERMTPNVTLTETSGLQGGSVAVFIRGIGNDPGFSQGVGIYVDDVYMNRAAGSLLDVYDVSRIEILKGPQGNLYGRNTIGGAIKYITNEPSDELTGGVEVRVGSFNALQVKGHVSGPIVGDTLLGSFGALSNNRDGIQTNTVNGDDYWDKEVAAYRGSLVWNATDDLRIKLAADYNQDDSAPHLANRSGADAGYLGQIGFFITGATYFNGGTGLESAPNDASIAADVDDVSTTEHDIMDQFLIESTTLSLTAEWNINDNWALKSVTAQRDTDHDQPFDFDGSAQQFIHTFNKRTFEDFSQEFQLTYASDNLNAVMGVYYLDGETYYSLNQTTQYARLLATSEQFKDTTRDDRTDKSQSIYGSVDWSINDSWQVSLGGRYTQDEKEETQEADVTLTRYALALVNTGVYGTVPTVIRPGLEGAAADNANFVDWATPFTTALTQVTEEDTYAKDKWSEFSPSARVTYFANDDMMFYAGFSSGFKSGGFQRQSGLSTAFQPEIVDSYTLGMKTSWLDGNLRLNGEAFLNDYQDKQLATVALVDGELGETVGNVGALETSGFELELSWQPQIEGLALGLNVGYLDVDIEEFASFDDENNAINLANTTALGFSPDWTVQSRAAYEFPVAQWGNVMVGTDLSYRSKSYTNSPIDLTNTAAAAAQVQDEHAIWNAVVAFQSSDEKWRVALEGKNLEDKRVIVNSYDLTLFQTAGYNMPRTVTLSVGYEF